MTREDIKNLDRLFDQLPVKFGKTPRDRDPAMTLQQAAVDAADRVEDDEFDPEAIGLKTGTTNKHFNKLGQVHKFLRKHVEDIAPIDFNDFTAPIEEDEMEARMRYTPEQGRAIFNLPPWTMSMGRITSTNSRNIASRSGALCRSNSADVAGAACLLELRATASIYFRTRSGIYGLSLTFLSGLSAELSSLVAALPWIEEGGFSCRPNMSLLLPTHAHS